MSKFIVRDCTLLTRMSGVKEAANLRELRERVAACGENVLYHHFCETLLRPSFDSPDYHNDFAVWTKLCLDDRVLGERLGILDPYSIGSLEDLRGTMLDMLDERLSELPINPVVSKGNEFYFLEAITVVFETGDIIEEPSQLPAKIANMTNGSIFYHFIESRRRTSGGLDDFSVWLSLFGDVGANYSDLLSSIDFSFLTLAEMKNVLVECLGGIGE
ncbi:MAG: DUF5752 family protein [Geobacteraceae bacterium]|nr:DUF5752 family protein [Geobacteraceae bacterium]